MARNERPAALPFRIARRADPRRRPELWVSLLLAGNILGVFAPVFHFEFVNFDDPFYATENAQVRTGLTASGLRWAFTAHTGFWHPVTWLSLQADAELFGVHPAGFHASNLLLHLINSVLLFWILRGLTGCVGRSAVVALVFALHPLHVETVAWVSERKGLLSTLFGLLTIATYRWYVRRPGWGRYLVVFTALALGLMSKPMLVTMPLALLLLDYWPLGRLGRQNPATPGDPLRRLIAEKVPLLLLALVVSWATMVAEKKMGAIDLEAQAPLAVRLGNSAVAYVQYLAMTFWPGNLAVLYPRPQTPWSWGTVLAAGTLLAAILGLSLTQARRRPYLVVGWLWYLGTLVPVIGLVEVGAHLLADRYTYWPHLGLLVMVVWGTTDFLAEQKWPTLLFPLAGTVAVACLVASRQQLSYWQDGGTLWAHTLEVTQDNWLAHNNRGAALLALGQLDEAAAHFHEALRIHPSCAEGHANLGAVFLLQGDRDRARECLTKAIQFGTDPERIPIYRGDLYWLAGKMAEARGQFEAALRLNPASAAAHGKLGLVLLAQGKAAEAEQHFSQALHLQGASAPLLGNLGAALYNQGRLDEAVDQLTRALQLDPHYAAGHLKLGLILQRQGKLTEALHHDEEALGRNPRLAEAHNQRGMVLEDLGQGRKAIDCYRRAVQLAPAAVKYHCNLASALRVQGHEEAAQAEEHEADRLCPNWPRQAIRVAWDLATAADTRLRFGSLAVRLARQACQATGYRRPDFLETLAAAYAETGRYDEAANTIRQALALAGASSSSDWLGRLQTRLDQYGVFARERRGPG